MDRANAIVSVCELLDQRLVMIRSDQGARVARDHDDGECSEHGVDGSALESLAKVRSREEGSGSLEQFLRGLVASVRDQRRPLADWFRLESRSPSLRPIVEAQLAGSLVRTGASHRSPR